MEPTVFNGPTSQWCHGAAITDPSGGTTIDTQARTATVSILAALRSVAVIAGAAALDVAQEWNATLAKFVDGPAITDPTGGTADTQLRTAISSILVVLRQFGIINGGTSGPAFVLDPTTEQDTTAAIASPSGGTTIDTECRAAITSALAAMRAASLISN